MDDQDYFNYDDIKSEIMANRDEIKKAYSEDQEEAPLHVQLRKQAELLTERIKKDEAYLKSKEGLTDFFHNEKKEELTAKRFQLAKLLKDYKEAKGSEGRQAVEAVWRQRASEIVEGSKSKNAEANLAQAEHKRNMMAVVDSEMQKAKVRAEIEEGKLRPKGVM